MADHSLLNDIYTLLLLVSSELFSSFITRGFLCEGPRALSSHRSPLFIIIGSGYTRSNISNVTFPQIILPIDQSQCAFHTSGFILFTLFTPGISYIYVLPNLSLTFISLSNHTPDQPLPPHYLALSTPLWGMKYGESHIIYVMLLQLS